MIRPDVSKTSSTSLRRRCLCSICVSVPLGKFQLDLLNHSSKHIRTQIHMHIHTYMCTKAREREREMCALKFQICEGLTQKIFSLHQQKTIKSKLCRSPIHQMCGIFASGVFIRFLFLQHALKSYYLTADQNSIIRIESLFQYALYTCFCLPTFCFCFFNFFFFFQN